jgi:hypothetical protein
LRLELKLLGQAHGLTPVVHEDSCFALHVPSGQCYGMYTCICLSTNIG